jgi:hypothetical protein
VVTSNQEKRMPDHDLPIEPSTKVGALLDRYPELQDVLIEIAPPFKKLMNPLLRRSIAKVASLRQAAAAGNVPVDELVNRLRAEVGQDPIAADDDDGGEAAYFSSRPDWFDPTKIVASIDDREASDPDKMTLAAVAQKAAPMRQTEILELITSFLPAPGIDIMKKKGLLVWSVREQPELIKTYFTKPPDS